MSPSIHFPCLLISNQGHGGSGAYPNIHGMEDSEIPWTSCQWITGLTQRQTNTRCAFWFSNSTKLHVFGLWEETGAPRGNPHKHVENMQTPHRKDRVVGFKEQSSSVDLEMVVAIWDGSSPDLHDHTSPDLHDHTATRHELYYMLVGRGCLTPLSAWRPGWCLYFVAVTNKGIP